jgi:hypothetical protein
MGDTMDLFYPVVQMLRQATHHTRFERRLGERLKRLSNDRDQAAAALTRTLTGIVQRPPAGALRKGAPDMVAIQRGKAQEMLSLLPQLGQPEQRSQLLTTARWLAAVDPRDEDTFQAFGLAFVLANAEVLAAMQAYLRPYVVLHMSCRPRLDRAQKSTQSFNVVNDPRVAQITVVGGGTDSALYQFDTQSGVLTVPAGDSYDQLAAKVVSAYFILAMVPTVQCVLKVDDDHRLGSAQALLSAFKRFAGQTRAGQWGKLYHNGFYGGHNRGWHLGKCGTAPINSQPYTYHGVLRWATGEEGYFINRGSLNRMIWTYAYFQQAVDNGLYEDVVMSDNLVRLGARLTPWPMQSVLAATVEY